MISNWSLLTIPTLITITLCSVLLYINRFTVKRKFFRFMFARYGFKVPTSGTTPPRKPVKAWDECLSTLEKADSGVNPIEQIKPNLYRVECRKNFSSDMWIQYNSLIYRYFDSVSGDAKLLFLGLAVMSESHMAELEKLGEPSIVIVPNAFHRAGVAQYKARYPTIRVLGSKNAPGTEIVSEVADIDGFAEDVLPQLGIHVHNTSTYTDTCEMVLELPITRDENKSARSTSNTEYVITMVDLLQNNVADRVPASWTKQAGAALDGKQPYYGPAFMMAFVTDRTAAKTFLRMLAERAAQDNVVAIMPLHGEIIQGDNDKSLSDRIMYVVDHPNA
jgi:hypothetical protein